MNRLKLVLLVSILLFGTLTARGKSVERRVLVVHSYEESYEGYPTFNQMIEEAFEQKKVDVELRYLYLDCESYLAAAELKRMYLLLDSMTAWKPELILVNEDQATYSLLKCGHPYLKKVPIVFGGVNYPNWELIKKYPNVTGFRDKIDIKKNFEMARVFMGDNIRFFTIMDTTYLDRKIDADLQEQLKDEDITWVRKRGDLSKKTDYKGTGLFLRYISVRNARSSDLIWNLSKFHHGKCYIQLKRDFTTISLGNVNAGLSFTAINDGFGFNERLLGGYMTTLQTQVAEEVDAAVSILHGTEVSAIPIRESSKEYVVNWRLMEYYGISLDKIPSSYKILNIPFSVKYRTLWLFLVVLVTIVLITIITWLIYLYHREQDRKKKAQSDLEDKKEVLELAIEGSNTFAWQLDDDRFTFETAFWESLGVPVRELTIENLISLSHPDDRQVIYDDWKAYLLARKKMVQLRCDFNGKGYQWWEFRYTTTQLPKGNYRTAGLLLNIQQIKDKEYELEEARRLAEKAELKESFLTNMSHEIRTPLNAIVGFTNVINSEEDMTKEEKQEYINIINMNTEQLLKLINDILEISRLDSGQMSFDYSTCEVGELVNDIYQTHSMLIPSGLQFLKEVSSDVSPLIEVDRGRVMQVLTNFLNNACKFTQQGYIKLGWQYAKDTSEVHIYVEDTGKGIPVEEQKMIFSRFYKQDEFAQGTGLGLSICKAIIEKLNGRIELQSEVGKGSRFSIVLPCRI